MLPETDGASFNPGDDGEKLSELPTLTDKPMNVCAFTLPKTMINAISRGTITRLRKGRAMDTVVSMQVRASRIFSETTASEWKS